MRMGIRPLFGVVLSLLLIFLFASCNFHKEASSDIIQYVENPENGLRKSVSIGVCSFQFQYKPNAYILKQEHDENSTMKTERLHQLDSMVWFNVTIQINGYNDSPLKYAAMNYEEYTARLNYYINNSKSDYYLVTGKDTLYATAYWFEDNKGLTPNLTMIVGFKLRHASRAKHNLIIAYYDRVFRSGIIKTVFNIKDIDAVSENI